MLDAEGRLGSTIPEELLVGVGLSERQTVVDFGCGPGFLTVPAAKVVGPLGRVYAVDIEQRMLDVVEARAADAGVENVSAVLSPGGKTPLGDGIADFVVCSLVIHDAPGPEGRVELAGEAGRMLRSSGRMLVIEWTPQPGDDMSRRMTSEETSRVLLDSGLELDEPKPLGSRQYMIVARWPRS
jgi:ubiquinone/menaquinone biosynthesis C-methylase UbiE